MFSRSAAWHLCRNAELLFGPTMAFAPRCRPGDRRSIFTLLFDASDVPARDNPDWPTDGQKQWIDGSFTG